MKGKDEVINELIDKFNELNELVAFDEENGCWTDYAAHNSALLRIRAKLARFSEEEIAVADLHRRRAVA